MKSEVDKKDLSSHEDIRGESSSLSLSLSEVFAAFSSPPLNRRLIETAMIDQYVPDDSVLANDLTGSATAYAKSLPTQNAELASLFPVFILAIDIAMIFLDFFRNRICFTSFLVTCPPAAAARFRLQTPGLGPLTLSGRQQRTESANSFFHEAIPPQISQISV